MDCQRINWGNVFADFQRYINEARANAWDEGCSAFETAHRWDNAEPWQHLIDNPYREGG